MNDLTYRQRAIMVKNVHGVQALAKQGYLIVTEPARRRYGLPESKDHFYMYRKLGSEIDLVTFSRVPATEFTGAHTSLPGSTT